ncbi:TniB family NTP-binding protein [Bacillus mesophilum]|nr:TniB family NTP-binding protein [Bacillus mesophilum]
MRGIILEGYSNSGKTSILKELKKLHSHDHNSERSVIVLSEHYSQVLHRVNGTLTSLNQDEHLNLLTDRVKMLKQLSMWAKEVGDSHRSKGIFFILERFHLNHRTAFSNSAFHKLNEIEAELFGLGAMCALLTISTEQAENRLKSRNPEHWRSKTEKETQLEVDHLIHTQHILRQHANNSIIPTLELNTDQQDWERYAKIIYPAD